MIVHPPWIARRRQALPISPGALRAGHAYRREDLARVSNVMDRQLREPVAGGQLKKLAQGLYYAPRQSRFGAVPPDDHALVEAFLRDKDFLIFFPSAYNTLGLATSGTECLRWGLASSTAGSNRASRRS